MVYSVSAETAAFQGPQQDSENSSQSYVLQPGLWHYCEVSQTWCEAPDSLLLLFSLSINTWLHC